MKKQLLIGLTAVSLLSGVLLGLTPAATITFQEGVSGYTGTDDGFGLQNSSTANRGGMTTMYLGSAGSGQLRNGWIRFDVLALDGLYQSINSIKIELFNILSQNNVSELNFGAIAASNRFWVEGTGGSGGPAINGTASYASQQHGSLAWSSIPPPRLGEESLTVPANTANNWVTLNITTAGLGGSSLTDLIDTWINQEKTDGDNAGVYLRDATFDGAEQRQYVTSENSTIANRPKLTIEYTTIPEPSTLCLTALGLLPLGFVGWRRRGRA